MKNKNAILVFGVLFLLVVLSRSMSHFWNFTMAGGAFLFAGSYFKDKKAAFALMLSSMLASDLVIGFHNQMLPVYLAYALVVAMGLLVPQGSARLKILGFAFLGTFSFFIITNFAVWYEGQMYAQTFNGLVDCYIAGLPFYRNQLISDVVSALAIFEVARYAFATTETAKAKV
ncbi:MAG: DUF6580 family putative transport protein [Pseudobdellovibrio sp.]